MKDKIIMLVIGILIGAIITAACFLLFSKNNEANFKGGNRPDMENFVPGENMPEGMERGKMRNSTGEGSQATDENTNNI